MSYSPEQMEEMERAYIACALWSTWETDSDGGEGDPLDATYGREDLAPETLELVKEDCKSFVEAAGSLLKSWTPDEAGHNLWLTRNGHGAGFWDRDLPCGDELTALCRHNENDWFVGDDGKIYQMGGAAKWNV